MYKVLLADDEGIVLDSLRFIIDRNFEGLCEVRTARTGRMAVEVAQEFSPDIALLDIQMPGLNGIEAMKEMRTFLKQTIFVVISAYDRFDYARKAISLGAREYLLKPFSRDRVTESLGRAMEAIREERRKRSKELMIREKLQSVVPVIENGFLNMMLFQEGSPDQLEYYRQLLELRGEYGIVMAIQFGERDRSLKSGNPVGCSVRLQGAMMRVRESVRGFLPGAVVSEILANRLFLFLPMEKSNLETEEADRLKEKTRSLLRSLQKTVNLKYRAGIGEVCPLQGMKKSCVQAQRALKWSTDSVVYSQEVLHLNCSKTETELQEEGSLMSETAQEAVKRARPFFDWVLGHYGECPGELKARVMDLLLSSEGRENADIREHRQNNQITEKARKYIGDHFDRDLSLEEVAEYAGISPYYLSKLFKEAEGKNFVEYVTELRMEKAKELLKAGEGSIKEICVSVGYGDPNYFSRIFKRYMGQTPTEYREGRAE